jgi:predicted phage terminase large subunit-like protein
MPPRHGKSETVSVWTPIWLLNAWPAKKVMLVSYEADFASNWGRRARNIIEENPEELLVRLAQDSTAANRWHTPEGGGMTTAGAGGSLTGRGADLLIIDDPHKNAEDAWSKAHRERVWDWYTTTAFTRLEPGAAVIVVGTRWHEDDLIGRILAQEAEAWTSIRLPALAEENDLLGRAVDAPLWPERFGKAALEKIRRSVGEQTWEGLYQQRPMGDGGAFFKKEWLDHRYDVVADRVYRLPDGRTVKLADLTRFATVDLAVSLKTSADYSVIAVFGQTQDRHLLVLHIDRARREGPDHIPAMKRVMAVWNVPVIWIEKTGFQLSIVQEARKAGIYTRELTADRDKLSRALLATAAFEGGRILLPRAASWLRDFENEVLSFPRGAHDDQVDALSYGVKVQASYMNVTSCSTSADYGLHRRKPFERPSIWDDPWPPRDGNGHRVWRPRLWDR